MHAILQFASFKLLRHDCLQFCHYNKLPDVIVTKTLVDACCRYSCQSWHAQLLLPECPCFLPVLSDLFAADS